MKSPRNHTVIYWAISLIRSTGSEIRGHRSTDRDLVLVRRELINRRKTETVRAAISLPHLISLSHAWVILNCSEIDSWVQFWVMSWVRKHLECLAVRLRGDRYKILHDRCRSGITHVPQPARSQLNPRYSGGKHFLTTLRRHVVFRQGHVI